jgi:membrane protease YdiL (CAAX protease family)
MISENPLPARPVSRSLYFFIFLLCGLGIYVVSVTFSASIPNGLELFLRLFLAAFFLVLALYFKKKPAFEQIGWVFYALFVAAFVLLLSWAFSSYPRLWLGLELETAPGVAAAKFFSSLLIVVPILILTLLSGHRFSSVYFQKGKIRSGLILGGLGFVVMTALALLLSQELGPDVTKLLPFIPWILIFCFSNALNEELLFRGLFLKKLQPLLGKGLSNLLCALIFTFAHVQVTYTPDLIFFLVSVFILALLWGYLIQRTDSLLASVLFHAGADMLVIIPIMLQYGVALNN